MDFIFDNFIIIWLCCLFWAVGSITFLHYSNKKKGLYFQDPESSNVIYSESSASGKSNKSFFSKIGGASNCLKIIITSNHLFVRPIFPILIFGPKFDLIHKIPISQIQNIEKEKGSLKNSIYIEFSDGNMSIQKLSIVSKNTEDLFATLTNISTQIKEHEY